MKKFLYKFLVIMLALGMLTPSWITKMWQPIKAEAASTTIIVDNSDTGFSKTGLWELNSNSSGYGGNFYVEKDDDTLAEPPRTAKWQPTITVAGLYQVFIHWSARDNRGTDAIYSVNYSGGIDTAIIDQTKKADGTVAGTSAVASGWKLLGSYDFIAGTSGNITLTESANGRTTADAVKFVHDNVLPSTPVLATPTNQFLTNSSSIDFSWQAANDSDDVNLNYDFELYESSTLVSNQINLASTNLNVPSLTAGEYSWRIRSFDGESYSLWSLPLNFVIDTELPARPTANPAGSTYYSTQNVVLSCTSIDLDSIYYTLDGSDPDKTKIKYTTPIVVDSSLNLRAIAYDVAGNLSPLLDDNYIISAPAISGQGANYVTSNSATVSWATDHDATSRVVYDTVSHPTVGSAPNYGYAYSTIEDANLVMSHSVALAGLTPGTIYYYRTVSHGSPEAVGAESSFKTSQAPVVTTTVATVSQPETPAVAETPTTSSVEKVVETPVTTEQGQIKGADTTQTEESEDINWTPWIILFILIILAGAATGGYFYWFGKDEDEEIISSEVIEKSKKPETKKQSSKSSASVKNSKRW